MHIVIFAFLFENLYILVLCIVMKRKTIRNHRDFLTTPNDLMVRSDCFIAKAKNAKLKNDARYGLIVSKRNFKLAVDRNRAKRLLRDWIAFNEELMLPDMDYIFIAGPRILTCSREDGRKKIYQVLTKLAQLHINNAK